MHVYGVMGILITMGITQKRRMTDHWGVSLHDNYPLVRSCMPRDLFLLFYSRFLHMASAAPVGQDHPNYDSKHHIRYKEQNSVDTTNTCSDNRCSYRGGGGGALRILICGLARWGSVKKSTEQFSPQKNKLPETVPRSAQQQRINFVVFGGLEAPNLFFVEIERVFSSRSYVVESYSAARGVILLLINPKARSRCNRARVKSHPGVRRHKKY